ncbi:MAG: 3-dehydroquinate synthase, partial [Xanthomonadales bacterium]|nr:3-dehydroquinate synthase [Xanthomonadales bacterium]
MTRFLDPLPALPVTTPGGSYEIVLGRGALADPRAWLGLPAAQQAVIVSNVAVAPLYAQALQQALAPHYAQVSLLPLADG